MSLREHCVCFDLSSPFRISVPRLVPPTLRVQIQPFLITSPNANTHVMNWSVQMFLGARGGCIRQSSGHAVVLTGGTCFVLIGQGVSDDELEYAGNLCHRLRAPFDWIDWVLPAS